MTREQMIAWLTLEGWTEGGTEDDRRWAILAKEGKYVILFTRIADIRNENYEGERKLLPIEVLTDRELARFVEALKEKHHEQQ